jgi:hypothetical protein
VLSFVEEFGGRVGNLLGPLLAPAAVVLAVLVIVGIIGALLSGVRQFTSELGRVWLMVGVAWFFFLRGAPVAERMARSRNPVVSLIRYAWPLAFVGSSSWARCSSSTTWAASDRLVCGGGLSGGVDRDVVARPRRGEVCACRARRLRVRGVDCDGHAGAFLVGRRP